MGTIIYIDDFGRISSLIIKPIELEVDSSIDLDLTCGCFTLSAHVLGLHWPHTAPKDPDQGMVEGE